MVWSVAALLQAVGDALAARFAAVTVAGELSGFTRAASGHCYFSLKDADGGGVLIRCAMFRRAASLAGFAPRDGQRVELRGRLAVYEPRGELQFVVESMQLAGAGSLFEEFLRLKARLESEGLFDAQRKRPLPAFPRTLGVITSPAAAALRDVLSTLARRAPHVRVELYPSPVQGPEAPAALVQALALANERAQADVLLLCRGGGSLEDLWAFNDERLVRAVAASRLPVVCGVGHETDISLCDFAADLRAPTPTAAAELAAPRTADCEAALAALASRLSRRLHQRLEAEAQRLDGVALRLARPLEGLRRHQQRLALIEQRLQGLPERRLERARLELQDQARRLARAVTVARRQEAQGLAHLASRLQALDPRQVLQRGYAWLADDAGQPLPGIAGLQPGQALRAVLVDGELDTRILAVRPAPPGAG